MLLGEFLSDWEVEAAQRTVSLVRGILGTLIGVYGEVAIVCVVCMYRDLRSALFLLSFFPICKLALSK